MTVSTPALDVMACDLEELARARGHAPELEFGLRFRSYASRLEHHKRERRKYRALADSWEEAEEAGEVDPASEALYRFYLFEEDYNARLVAKYSHFLFFLPKAKDRIAIVDDLMARLDALEAEVGVYDALEEDDEFMGAEDAEEAARHAREAYDIPNAHVLADHPHLLDEFRAERGREGADAVSRVLHELADDALTLERDEDGSLLRDEDGRFSVVSGLPWDFDAVKALDIHHLDYDFPFDVEVSRSNVLAFSVAAEERSRLLDAAITYLEETGQTAFLSDLPVEDVAAMVAKEAVVTQEGRLRSPVEQADAGISRAHPTVSLDDDVNAGFMEAIRESVGRIVSELRGASEGAARGQGPSTTS